MARMRALRAESVWAALGGVLAGYVLWLIAFSIGDFLTTAGVWGPIVLASRWFSRWARRCGARRVRARRKSHPGGVRVRVAGSAGPADVLVLADTYL